MQSQIIEISDRQLVGEWHYANPKDKKRLIVICHGYQGSSDHPTILAITKGLNEGGHDTFTFDFSSNAGGFDIEHQVHDIAKIVKHFESYKEIVVLAASFGALTAAIATIQTPKITGLITLNGFFGEGNLGQNHRKTYLKFRAAALVIPKYRKILSYYKRELRPERITVPVLVIHSKVDPYVYILQSQHFYEKLVVPKQFVELQNAKHGITAAADRRKVVNEINMWLTVQK